MKHVMVSDADGEVFMVTEARWTSLLAEAIKGSNVVMLFDDVKRKTNSGVVSVGPIIKISEIGAQEAIELLMGSK